MMNLDDILNLDRLICTGDVARAGWVIDQDAVIEAMDILEVKYQVRIRFMTGKYTMGVHRERKTHHAITLDQNYTMKNANFTLWHELVHCMQAERWAIETGRDSIVGFYREYKRGDGVWGQSYSGNRYELEANRLAAQNEFSHPLLALA